MLFVGSLTLRFFTIILQNLCAVQMLTKRQSLVTCILLSTSWMPVFLSLQFRCRLTSFVKSLPLNNPQVPKGDSQVSTEEAFDPLDE